MNTDAKILNTVANQIQQHRKDYTLQPKTTQSFQ